MDQAFLDRLSLALQALEQEGASRHERVIESSQRAEVEVAGAPRELINLCANNYLGLADHPAVVAAAGDALQRYGYGMASVRFICGTHVLHKTLEERLTSFLGTEDTILYGSCFDANTGLFETLLTEDDAVISDALNHASIIDGIRLSKAKRLRYDNHDMLGLEARLKEAASARARLIATDGVFSMDGSIARLEAICELADRYRALVMVDDSHGAGVVGPRGRGTPEHCGVEGRIDIVTGTLGKALGGASGGFTSGRREIVSFLRQRSRPYLFSNSLPPPIVAASIAVLDLIEGGSDLRDRLWANTDYFRQGLADAGYRLPPGRHPIIPILIGDAARARELAAAMFDAGVYVVAFAYPVVPQGQARLRVQISAAHRREHLDAALQAFREAGHKLGLIA